MSKMSIPAELPKSIGEASAEPRMVTIPRAWFPNAHMTFYCDFEGPEGVKVRLAHFSQDSLVKIDKLVITKAKATTIVVPTGVEAISIMREASDPESNTAPCGFRIDMWD